MRFLIPLALVILVACAHVPDKVSVATPGQVNWQSFWVQNGCHLYFGESLKSYPGQFCIFLDDGSFISATGTSMRRFSPSQEILWEVPGHYHHQLNLSPDKKRILTLSSAVTSQNGKRVRKDTFLIFDLDGKLLHKTDADSIVKQTKVKPVFLDHTPELQVVKADLESSHFNSIYEIPENAYSKSVPWLAKNNIIVNGTFQGVFILSPDLSKVLKRVLVEGYEYANFHDVQISPDGTLLYFNNRTVDPQYVRFSTVQKYDLITKKLTMEFRASPREAFYSPACGGVQEVGDLIFFSHITAGGFLWSPAKNEMVKAIPGTNGNAKEVRPTQQLKLIDVEKFFKNSK